MKQLLCSPGSGEVVVVDAPAPEGAARCEVVKTGASAVSAGTERLTPEFAQKNLLEKARSRPDLVRQTLIKARCDGVLTAFHAVHNRFGRLAGQRLEVSAPSARTHLAVQWSVEGHQ